MGRRDRGTAKGLWTRESDVCSNGQWTLSQSRWNRRTDPPRVVHWPLWPCVLWEHVCAYPRRNLKQISYCTLEFTSSELASCWKYGWLDDLKKCVCWFFFPIYSFGFSIFSWEMRWKLVGIFPEIKTWTCFEVTYAELELRSHSCGHFFAHLVTFWLQHL